MAVLENLTIYSICVLWRFLKWFSLQFVLLFFMPYVWGESLDDTLLALMVLYNLCYAVYWEFVEEDERGKWILAPYGVYAVCALLIWLFTDSLALWLCLLLPAYGGWCFVAVKFFRKAVRKFRCKRIAAVLLVSCLLIVLKIFCVLWETRDLGTFESEKSEILQRRDFLADKLSTTPQKVLNEMPSGIGPQFQGEWALYSCSMFAKALANISALYPETKEANRELIGRMIEIVKSQEIRAYDTERWHEDPLETLSGEKSHVSYLSHLAWMICNYKFVGGDEKYDSLLDSFCEAMNRRILQSGIMNLPTYPEESIYIPDMLVAIVALHEYSRINGGRYSETVQQWIEKAKVDWIDGETELLVSFLRENGEKYTDAPVKGSYSALNCYYLSLIDAEFAREQYEKLKSNFLQTGLLFGIKEYCNDSCLFGMDIDAGPILFGLSPSGTAFVVGPAVCFRDTDVYKRLLRTAEIAGHSIVWNKKRHYLLANIALVGETIMLAMRTSGI